MRLRDGILLEPDEIDLPTNDFVARLILGMFLATMDSKSQNALELCMTAGEALGTESS